MEIMKAKNTACLLQRNPFGPDRKGYTIAEKKPVIVLPTCKGIMVIPVQQIIRIQSISNYSKLFFDPVTGGRKTLVVAKVLRFFEEHPQLSSFVRIHRTHLVNINYINTYTCTKSSALLLLNGEIFSVSRRKKACLVKRLNSLNNSFAFVFNTKKIIAA